MRPLPLAALVIVVVGAGAFAYVRASSSSSSSSIEPAPAPAPEPMREAPALPPSDETVLPPGHPSIESSGSMHGDIAPNDDQPSITWKVPSSWQTQPNPNPMRIATYRVPHASGDAEMSVTRAGGSTDANIQRWVGQFEDAGKETRTTTKVRGIPITVVDVKGTFMGGGPMMGGSGARHPGWALRAAIVETQGTPYFFKLTGPAAAIDAARKDFDALVASITPSAS